jgi:sirohydrochlorin ferrochelatase
MTLVLVAHGTREEAGVQEAYAIGAAVQAKLPDVDVRVAFADVCGPDVTMVLQEVASEDTVVVPMFLASGYHVKVDVPGQIARSGHPSVTLTDPLGPAPELVEAVHERLKQAGYREGHEVVLAAAGSSNPQALADVATAAEILAKRLGKRVQVGYVTTSSPRVDELVAEATGRVAVASWLLAPGLFHRWLSGCGAEVLSAPIGAQDALVDLVVSRYASNKPLRATARERL